MSELSFVDSKFDKNKSKQYDLSIRVSSDGFSFSIFDTNQTCVALKCFSTLNQNSETNELFFFKQVLRNDELLNLHYHKANILWVSKDSVLIPNDFFNEQFAFDAFRLCHQIKQTDELLWNDMNALKAKNVFSMPAEFKDLLTKQFQNSAFYHHSTPFYNKAILHNIPDNHPTVFVNIQKSYFHIAVPDRNQKHFINHFVYKEDVDVVYFILNVYKHQKLNHERSKLVAEGLVQNESKLIRLLQKYLRFVEIEPLPDKLKIRKNIPDQEYNNAFVNLLNVGKCEL